MATPNDHAVIAQLDREMRVTIGLVTTYIRNSFPGVMHSIGTLSQGDGSGYISVTIEKGYVQPLQREFHQVRVSPIMSWGYHSAQTSFPAKAETRDRAAEVEDIIQRAMQGTLFHLHTGERGDVLVAIQGERVNDVRAWFPDVQVRAFTQAEYEAAAGITPASETEKISLPEANDANIFPVTQVDLVNAA